MKKENIDKLVNESLAIEQEEAIKAGVLGYMSRLFIQSTMPHSRIDGNEFKRINGAFKLVMLAESDVGLPYGSIPRLLMSWITTEAVKTKQRELILGRNLSEFMSELGMIPSGGRWGSITRLKNQMKRLFSASITCTYDDGKNLGIQNIVPIESADLWWDPKNPRQSAIWDSKLLLGDKFFQELIERPVPVDMRVLKALRQSPMAIDIYCWLTYRMSYLRKKTPISWNALKLQFGANYKNPRQFKSKFLGQLNNVLLVYPEAEVEEGKGSLILIPGKTHISKKKIYKRIEPIDQEKTKQTNPGIIKKNESEMQRRYLEYQLDTTVDIVENLSSHSERSMLLKDFSEYLIRKKLYEVRSQIIRGKHTKAVKEELFRFVKNYWNHILDHLKTYKEFCKTIAK